jgi:hypothetical protein
MAATLAVSDTDIHCDARISRCFAGASPPVGHFLRLHARLPPSVAMGGRAVAQQC